VLVPNVMEGKDSNTTRHISSVVAVAGHRNALFRSCPKMSSLVEVAGYVSQAVRPVTLI